MIDRTRAGHPSDEVLAALAADLGTDPGVAAHVAICPSCRARAVRWEDMLPPLTAALEAEADAAFPDQSLSRQTSEIMRRLRGVPKAKVLRFPAPPAEPAGTPRRLGGDSARWVAAAAVAGLMVGGSIARWLDPHSARPLTPASARVSAPGIASRTAEPSAEAVGDEAFLVEFDAALGSRAPAALRVLDALTPERDPNRPR